MGREKQYSVLSECRVQVVYIYCPVNNVLMLKEYYFIMLTDALLRNFTSTEDEIKSSLFAPTICAK